MCSELSQRVVSSYFQMWEVGAVLPLRQVGGGRPLQMWEVGVVLPLRPEVGGGSCATTPSRLEVGVLSPDVGGGSCAATQSRWEVGAVLPLRQGWRWESSL